jgi:hypothetical protein
MMIIVLLRSSFILSTDQIVIRPVKYEESFSYIDLTLSCPLYCHILVTRHGVWIDN